MTTGPNINTILIENSDSSKVLNSFDQQRKVCSFHEMKRALLAIYDQKVARWFLAMDYYDKGITEHTLRVTGISLAIGRLLDLSLDDLHYLQFGTIMHDIGKLGIPDAIIQKPGKLSAIEFEVVKRHPVYGYEWISKNGYFVPARVIPLHHHEHWDGMGYPYQFAAKEIPLLARVVAVADVWDAITSDRPYRKAMTNDQAAQILVNEAGKQFDPEIVDAFFSLGVQEGKEIDFVSALVF